MSIITTQALETAHNVQIGSGVDSELGNTPVIIVVFGDAASIKAPINNTWQTEEDEF